MKKALIVFAAVMSTGFSAVNAADLSLSFDGSRSGVISAAAPEAAVPQAVPARTFQAAYELGDVDKMNKVLDNTIAYAETRNSPEVVAGLKCLRQTGTPTQKALFVYGPGTYALPETCQAPGAMNKGIVDDVVHCVEKLVCEMITETVIKWACDEDGKCMYQPVEVLRQTCHKICEE